MTNNPGRPTTNSHGNRSALTTSDRSIEGAAESLEENKSYLFHSKLVNQFVNDLLGCNYVRSSHPHAHTVLSALRDVLSPEAEQQTCSSADDMLDCIDPVSQNTKTMPPQAEAITVLRWATGTKPMTSSPSTTGTDCTARREQAFLHCRLVVSNAIP
jgi:hypothetical protein